MFDVLHALADILHKFFDLQSEYEAAFSDQ